MTEFLHCTVELLEKYDTIPAGAIGICTADLEEAFAVSFKDHGWATFIDKDIRKKFKIINMEKK